MSLPSNSSSLVRRQTDARTMRVLMLHDRYLVRGGEDESTDAEVAALRDHGIEVDLIEEDNRRVGQLGRVRTAARTLWAREWYRTIRARVAERRYDVVHVQNFFPLLSPAVHHAARAEGAAVVQTLRNYRLFCLNGLLFRDGMVCEKCLGRAVSWAGVRHRCYRRSLAGSATVAAMQVLHRKLSTWEQCVDVFLTPTYFTRGKAIEGGLDPTRILVKPNFVAPDPGVGHGDGGYLLFIGRVSPEKGLEVLLRALPLVQCSTVPRLKVVGEGEGPSKESALGSVEWLGRKTLPEVYQLMGAAQAVIVPSVWYETFGRVIVEAYAKGTPVIASNQGALAELVIDGVTGLLFRPGDVADLADKISDLLNRSDVGAMRQAARARYEAEYTAALNVEALVRCYNVAIAAQASQYGNQASYNDECA